jgi:hypothetical protein
MSVGIICLGQLIHRLIIIDMGTTMVLRKISLLPLLLNLHHPQRRLGLLVRRVNRIRVPLRQLLQYLQAVDGDWGLGIVYPVRFSLLNRSSLVSNKQFFLSWWLLSPPSCGDDLPRGFKDVRV